MTKPLEGKKVNMYQFDLYVDGKPKTKGKIRWAYNIDDLLQQIKNDF